MSQRGERHAGQHSPRRSAPHHRCHRPGFVDGGTTGGATADLRACCCRFRTAAPDPAEAARSGSERVPVAAGHAVGVGHLRCDGAGDDRARRLALHRDLVRRGHVVGAVDARVARRSRSSPLAVWHVRARVFRLRRTDLGRRAVLSAAPWEARHRWWSWPRNMRCARLASSAPAVVVRARRSCRRTTRSGCRSSRGSTTRSPWQTSTPGDFGSTASEVAIADAGRPVAIAHFLPGLHGRLAKRAALGRRASVRAAAATREQQRPGDVEHRLQPALRPGRLRPHLPVHWICGSTTRVGTRCAGADRRARAQGAVVGQVGHRRSSSPTSRPGSSHRCR